MNFLNNKYLSVLLLTLVCVNFHEAMGMMRGRSTKVTIDKRGIDVRAKDPAEYVMPEFLIQLKIGQVVELFENEKLTIQITRTANGYKTQEFKDDGSLGNAEECDFDAEIVKAESERLAQEVKKSLLSIAEVGTATSRLACIIVNQQIKNKFGENSKKTLISDMVTNAFRIANEVTMLCNEKYKNRNTWLNWAAASYSLIDVSNIALSIKKLAKKEYSDDKKITEQKQSSKLLTFINNYVPYFEGVAALVRSGAKLDKFNNHTDFENYCTLFICFARAAEFYASAEGNNNTQAMAYGLAAVVVLATISDILGSKPVPA